MNVSLPEFPGRANAFQGGRNAYEGYQRGWGLQYGTLKTQIRADPLYARARRLAGSRSVMTEDNRMNIFLLLRFFFDRLPSRDIIEFGSYRGGNAIFMAACLKKLHPGAVVHALDTYRGIPTADAGVDLHSVGDFGDVNLTETREFAAREGLDNIRFVEGRFEDTVEGVYREAGSFGLAHIDCDIHAAVAFAQDSVLPHLCPGGYLVYDDALFSSCLGATQAVEELIMARRMHSEQAWPHFVFRKPL